MMGSTCSQGVEDKECIQKCSWGASWKTKNMAGNWSLKKEISGIKGGYNWLRTISNSRGYSVWLLIISYSTETSILFETILWKKLAYQNTPQQHNLFIEVGGTKKRRAIVIWIISYKLKHEIFWKNKLH